MGVTIEAQVLADGHGYAEPNGHIMHDVFYRGAVEMLSPELRVVHPLDALRGALPVIKASRHIAKAAFGAVGAVVQKIRI